MKKVFLFLFTLIVGQCVAYAENNIHLVQHAPPVIDPDDEPRSIVIEVTASIDDQVITVSFGEMTASQIVVTNSSDLQVFNQTYSPAFSVQANLSTLPSGSYTIHIYASGCWWYGYFDL
ncbi:MAG: DUF3244 domain-containing protein [Bacteroidaceae bacterium]|nr:DUF3244 domain-containing protein [Bacteroidaceae bacterium]